MRFSIARARDESRALRRQARHRGRKPSTAPSGRGISLNRAVFAPVGRRFSGTVSNVNDATAASARTRPWRIRARSLGSFYFQPRKGYCPPRSSNKTRLASHCLPSPHRDVYLFLECIGGNWRASATRQPVSTAGLSTRATRDSLKTKLTRRLTRLARARPTDGLASEWRANGQRKNAPLSERVIRWRSCATPYRQECAPLLVGARNYNNIIPAGRAACRRAAGAEGSALFIESPI